MPSCVDCGIDVRDQGVCPVCRKLIAQPDAESAAAPPRLPPATAGERIAAAAAYVAPLVPMVLLLIPHFRRSTLVRFHAIQSLLVYLALTILALLLAAAVLTFLNGMVVLLVWPLYGLACLVLWVLLVVKAARAELFQLPLLGGVALRASGI